MTFSDQLIARVNALFEACAEAGLTIATAESCTGGLVAACLTAVAGSSRYVERGFVTYSNQAKTEMLGVPADLIAGQGAVSEAVARAMAQGALTRTPASLAVAITGIAGPAGGTPDKPVGLVHLAAARRGRPTLHRRCQFGGDRGAVRAAALAEALSLLDEQARAD